MSRIGRYEVLNHLASGGMGQVYLARATGLGGFERQVVVKTLDLSINDDEDDDSFVTMFLDEARLVGALHHQYIAPVYEVGCDEGGRYFLVMDYVHGETAEAVFRATGERGMPIPLAFALTVGSCIAAALDYAHALCAPDGSPLDIVHRDVSLSNVMIGYDGGVKLIDFGIAKAANRATKTQVGTLKGKIGYLAPEQILRKQVDHRADIFALGIVLYELTTSTRAFRDTSDLNTLERITNGEIKAPSQLIADYPRELETIVMKALALDPSHRFQDAGSMGRAIEAYAAKQGIALGHAPLKTVMGSLFGERRVRRRLARSSPALKTDPRARVLDAVTPIVAVEMIDTGNESADHPTIPLDPAIVERARALDVGAASESARFHAASAVAERAQRPTAPIGQGARTLRPTSPIVERVRQPRDSRDPRAEHVRMPLGTTGLVRPMTRSDAARAATAPLRTTAAHPATVSSGVPQTVPAAPIVDPVIEARVESTLQSLEERSSPVPAPKLPPLPDPALLEPPTHRDSAKVPTGPQPLATPRSVTGPHVIARAATMTPPLPPRPRMPTDEQATVRATPKELDASTTVRATPQSLEVPRTTPKAIDIPRTTTGPHIIARPLTGPHIVARTPTPKTPIARVPTDDQETVLSSPDEIEDALGGPTEIAGTTPDREDPTDDDSPAETRPDLPSQRAALLAPSGLAALPATMRPAPAVAPPVPMPPATAKPSAPMAVGSSVLPLPTTRPMWGPAHIATAVVTRMPDAPRRQSWGVLFAMFAVAVIVAIVIAIVI